MHDFDAAPADLLGAAVDTNARIGIVDSQQPKIGTGRRHDNRQEDNGQPPLQRGPNQSICCFREDGLPIEIAVAPQLTFMAAGSGCAGSRRDRGSCLRMP